MPALTLYGTTCCHLCEQAETVLREGGYVVRQVDIAEDDELFEEYGLRIPVLQRADTSAELGWPFDAEVVGRFLG